MKKILLFSTAALLGLAAISSCNKLKDLAKVNINLENAQGEFTIPIILAAGEVSADASSIYINLDSFIKAENAEVGSKNIKEVHIKSCELQLLDGDSKNNFSALESCKMSIASDKNPSFTEIASVSGNPDAESQTLVLPANAELELKEYFLSATQFSYRLAATARKTTDKELKCKAVVKYTIVAGL